MKVDKWDQLDALHRWSGLAKDWNGIQRVEAELLQEGVKPFPINQAGLDAYNLWRLIKERLLRGASLELTPAELKLAWHRQRLKRARGMLLDMELIRRKGDDRYVLGRYSRIDDLTREELLNVHLMREVNLILGSLMPRQKSKKSPRSDA